MYRQLLQRYRNSGTAITSDSVCQPLSCVDIHRVTLQAMQLPLLTRAGTILKDLCLLTPTSVVASPVMWMWLSVDVFVATLLDGRRPGPQDAPSALETEFGWVLAGGSSSSRTPQSVSHHATLLTGDDLLRSFWEIEEATPQIPILSSEERMVMEHFTTLTLVPRTGDSSLLFPKEQMSLTLVNHARRLSDGFLTSRDLYTVLQQSIW